MANAINVTRLLVTLKSGRQLLVDCQTAEGKVNAQVEEFIKGIGNPKNAEKAFLFQGARAVLIRYSEVAALEVANGFWTPDEAPKAEEPKAEEPKAEEAKAPAKAAK